MNQKTNQIASNQTPALFFSFITTLILVTALPSCLSGLNHPERPSFNLDNYQTEEKQNAEASFQHPDRPDGLFSIKPSYCLCRAALPAMPTAGPHCQDICLDAGDSSNENTTSLIGQVEIKDTQLNDRYKEFKGELTRFCNLVLNEDEQNPRCYGRIKKLNGTSQSEYSLVDPGAQISFLEDNRFQINFGREIRDGESYSFRIQAHSLYTNPETGEQQILTGHTDRIEFTVDPDQESDEPPAPLMVGTINRYHCLIPIISNDITEAVIKRHFIFDANNSPPPIPSSASKIISCHNKEKWGSVDESIFPRRGMEYAFRIWDQLDRRFYREQGSAENDSALNRLIKEKLLKKHNITANGNFFKPFVVPSSPSVTVGSQTYSGTKRLGFYLPPIIGPQTDHQAICPSAEDLYRPPGHSKFDPVFSVLGEFISDTEAVYAALRVPRIFHPYGSGDSGSTTEVEGGSGNGGGAPVDDILWINESLLKNIWFYKNDDGSIEYLNPESKNFSRLVIKDLFFYWPPDSKFPTVKKDYQKTYEIKTIQEISEEIEGKNDETTIEEAPHRDRRYGCIPKSPVQMQSE